MSKIYRNPDVMWREEDESREQANAALEKGENAEDIGTSLLFSDGMMVTLNVLGTEIWKMCDGREVDEIVAELLTQFDVEADVLKNDVAGFLEELAEKGFIHYEE
ncbi:GeoRSP system PqqD family peptide chaperone [Geotalea uraniireducens]|uniref:PqqD family protein n=1 Tax=Geotalea uraniireducens (strain Rf4) TaxID=351605 RepID=A5GEV2_GEOUR|nr:GeoRSP system PqqD family peptide chaperone [Geotalea uraniireducens]ABQ25957.1 hypothetical protein Gura_1766 [Geotalea uraniireducens Rf4]